MTIGRNNLSWKKKELYHGTKNTGYKIYPSGPDNKFYRIQWPDGEISDDFYNLSRAKDNASRIYLKDIGESQLEGR